MSRALARLRRRAPAWRTTALAAVAAAPDTDPFRVLIGCLLSLRTKDETTEKAMERLMDGYREAILNAETFIAA